MPHKKIGGFLLNVTKAACINLALIRPGRKLSISSFANLLRMINPRQFSFHNPSYCLFIQLPGLPLLTN